MEKGLVLYRGCPATNRHAQSVFVIKLEFRLRYAGVKHKTDVGGPREGPNGKIPYVDVSGLHSSSTEDGVTSSGGKPELIPDSTIIIKTLIDDGVLPDLNARLTPEQALMDASVRALLEERLYFFAMAERWLENYYSQRDFILAPVPWLMRVIVGNIIHGKVTKTCHLQGSTRFTKEQQRKFREEIWQSLERMVADVKAKDQKGQVATGRDPFWLLGGDEPTEVDGALFAFVVSHLLNPANPESRECLDTLPELLDYTERIHDAYFPDYEKWK